MIAKLKSSALAMTVVFMAMVAAVLTASAQQGPAQPVESEDMQAITAPSADFTLSFVVPGRIGEISVKEGDFVPKGQLVARLEDEPEKIQARQYEAQARDKTKIMAAQAELAQKSLDLKKVDQAKAKGGANDWEVEHLRTGVRIADLSVKSAVFENEQYHDRHALALSQLDRMRLVSPIEGRVEKVSMKPGEAVNALDPVIRVVRIDPLWIEAHVPLAQTKKLAVGQEARVLFPGSEADAPQNGKIIHVPSVADAASETLAVRIEVANNQGRPAGERVTVKFP
jgi:membrane fusion protein, heavy metal efflux system